MTKYPVKAHLVSDIFDGERIQGAFEYFSAKGTTHAGMLYCCPCGCGRVGALEFKPAPSPSWTWDGNLETPTLNPSVHDQPQGVTHWHGWLRAGEWVLA